MGQIIYVSQNGSDQNDGSQAQPLRSISRAACIARPGDRVLVGPGEYREWVKPQCGGRSDTCRITYEAAAGAKVVIKGSERIQSWEKISGTVWRVCLPNSFFGDYNPYTQTLGGDWFLVPENHTLHTGEIYLNGKSFYEAKTLEAVRNPTKRTEGCGPPWTKHNEALLDPEFSIYQWYSEVDDKNTTIYANFHEFNPNTELVEINVRRSCFYPERTGLDYITVRGFEMAHAACPWAPPTADQPGLIGPHWSKGWVIESNIIHDAKCSAVSLGKEISTGHNDCTREHRKPGYQYQMEAVFRARQNGWSKETIGSHIVRNNTIYNCGQNGIVGHMGCVFSEITGNHIYNIGVKHEYFGHEIAGIKLHAAIDVQITSNNIHDCTLGTWLDWQAQGTRISRNLYYRNNRDLMIEVTHGPHLVDNNIFASEYNLDNVAQGGAYVHNLFCGTMRLEPVLDRATPYHFPHSTMVAGCALVFGGDDRMLQNIFVGGAPAYIPQSLSGTAGYGERPESVEEYSQKVASLGVEDHGMFTQVKDPAYIHSNVYYNGAKACDQERDNYIADFDPEVKIYTEGKQTILEVHLDKNKGKNLVPTELVTTETLNLVRIAEASFENPDGSTLVLDTDYAGAKRPAKPAIGPLEGLQEGYNRIIVWEEA